MIRLIKIEWLKIWPYRTFRFMLAAYFILILLLFLSPQVLNIGPFQVLSKETLKFPFIWQNMAFIISKFFNLLMCIVIISMITNEYSYRTVRQNVIDGMSRKEFILSKVLLIFLLSLAIALFVLIFGFFLGLSYSSSEDFSKIFTRSSFILGIFLQSFAIMSMAAFIAFVVKRTGLALVVFLLYILVVESLIRNQLEGDVVKFFPSKSIHSIIRTPYLEISPVLDSVGFVLQNHIFTMPLVAAMIYTGLFLYGSYYLVRKSDL